MTGRVYNKTMTSAERKRKERARKEKAGFIRFETWIKPKWLASIKKHIASLKGEI